MITDGQRTVLGELLQQEKISDILQAMTGLIATEKKRLEKTLDLAGTNQVVAAQAAQAVRKAGAQFTVMCAVTKEATAVEIINAGAFQTVAAKPVQMALF